MVTFVDPLVTPIERPGILLSSSASLIACLRPFPLIFPMFSLSAKNSTVMFNFTWTMQFSFLIPASACRADLASQSPRPLNTFQKIDGRHKVDVQDLRDDGCTLHQPLIASNEIATVF